jgi:hypothetical protein
MLIKASSRLFFISLIKASSRLFAYYFKQKKIDVNVWFIAKNRKKTIVKMEKDLLKMEKTCIF